MFAKEGFYFVIPSIIINIFIIIIFNYLYSSWFPYFGWFFSPLFILTAFFIFFFRDPSRKPEGDGLVAPTDGTVMSIEKNEGKITMFIELAASDVHTQKSPCDGKIVNIEKIKGAHHPIYFINKGNVNNGYVIPSTKNARNIIDIEDKNGTKIKITQIAGIIARRCKTYVKSGEFVKRGQRIGIIMFGSLLKLEVEGEYEITTQVGSHVKGGKHVILRKSSL